MQWYTLDEYKNPVATVSFPTDEEHKKHQRVAFTMLKSGKRVSTVFLFLDYNYSAGGEPILFETMVFPENNFSELECERYHTYKDAVAGHKRMVKKWKND